MSKINWTLVGLGFLLLITGIFIIQTGEVRGLRLNDERYWVGGITIIFGLYTLVGAKKRG
jgi:uncharacterized membrane protein